MTRRGNVVLVDFPFTDIKASKVRPALVVQNDASNRRLSNTIVAMISGNVKRAGEPTHLLIDPTTASGAGSGLHGISVVTCSNLFTVDQSGIIRTIGSLPAATMMQVDNCLKAALELK